MNSRKFDTSGANASVLGTRHAAMIQPASARAAWPGRLSTPHADSGLPISSRLLQLRPLFVAAAMSAEGMGALGGDRLSEWGWALWVA